MKENWVEYQIKDIIEGLFDGPHATPAHSDTGPVFLGVKNITESGRLDLSEIKHISELDFIDWTKRVLPSNDDIVFSYEASLHRYGLLQNDLRCCLGRRMGLLRLDKSVVDPRFLLYYFLSSEWRQTIEQSVIVGATVNRIPISEFHSFRLSLPPLEEQRYIAAVLSSLDAKIELNNRINADLEAMAKTLYDYWFVQFDFPDAQGKPYKSSGGKMVWHEALKREIPAGWEVKDIASVTAVITRGISPKYIEDGGICVLNQKCIRENKVLFDFSKRHDNQSKSIASKQVNLYDILVNSTGVGTLGRVAIVKRLPESIITIDSHVTIVRADNKKINPLYFGFSLIQKQKEIEGFSVGSTGQVELSRSQLEGVLLIKPHHELQDSFAQMYSNILNRMSICETENQQLSALRDWLLPMLMNGQVKVS